MTTTIATAKSTFPIYGVKAAGEPIVSRKLCRVQVLDFFRRLNACLVDMEARATSASLGKEDFCSWA